MHFETKRRQFSTSYNGLRSNNQWFGRISLDLVSYTTSMSLALTSSMLW